MKNIRLRVLAPLALLITLLGCATGVVTGGLTGVPLERKASTAADRIVVVFMDSMPMQPSGLSAFRVGTPSVIIGNDHMTAAYRRISSEMSRLLQDQPHISVTTQTSLAMRREPSPAAYAVVVTPRSMQSTPTNASAEVEIVIQEFTTKRILWKGETKITSGGAENNRNVAAGLIRAMQESGLVRQPKS